MHHDYEDIRKRIKAAPKWWDENGVPRYSDFGPREVADIYAHVVVLMEIECQNCRRSFRVAMVDRPESWKEGFALTREWVQCLHYGDPPNVHCCAAGPTMNSVPKRVLECWRTGGDEFTKPDPDRPGVRMCLPGYFDWRRLPELEIAIDCEWDREPIPLSALSELGEEGGRT